LTGEFLESHPLSGNRAKRFAQAEQKGASYSPALSAEQFQALKEMCGSNRD
ncbi:MAG: peptidase M48 family protein, partial [Sphingomonas sp.]|nr:peptidase M48 family protein [Sphingomonas sp.]